MRSARHGYEADVGVPIDRRRLLCGIGALFAAAFVPVRGRANGRVTVLRVGSATYAFVKPPGHDGCGALVRMSTMQARCARHRVAFPRCD